VVQAAPLPGATPVLVVPPLPQEESTTVGAPPGQVTVSTLVVVSSAIVPIVVPEPFLTTIVTALPLRPLIRIE
jgi:hypothetical protein